MKNNILKIFILLLLVGCNKEDDKIKPEPIFTMPLETQIGANTFGVTIRGKVYVPRTPTGTVVGSGTPNALIFWGTSSNQWNDLEIKDGASAVGFNMIIHLEDLFNLGIDKYILNESNFQDSIDSTPFNHIFFKIWDPNIFNYAYYGSVQDEGEVNVTRYSNDIFSGNFKGKFVRYDNPNDIIIITDGRFDIGPNLYNTFFP